MNLAKIATLIGLIVSLTHCTPAPTTNQLTPSHHLTATANNELIAPTRTPLPTLSGPTIDPISGITPKIDPEIKLLIDSVSEQQLIGYVQTLQAFGTRHSFSETEADDYGIGAARRWIYSEFVRVGNGRLQVDFQDFPAPINGFSTSQKNIIATLPGSSSYQGKIVLTAHYDSRTTELEDYFSAAPGANDNGSGVALLLELARLLSSKEWSQTIVFVATAGEEHDTYGSRFFVQEQLLDGALIDAAINNDIVGGHTGIKQSIRLFTPNIDSSDNGQLARYIDYVGGFYLPTFPIEINDAPDRENRFGDQREFLKHAIPAVRFTQSEELFELNHSRFDSWDLLNYPYLKNVTQLNLALIANMAGAPPPPPIAQINLINENQLQLQWATENSLADGYIIALRPIDQFRWAPFRFVRAKEAGNVILTNLPPNIYAVSIASISRNGRVSLFTPEQPITIR